MQCGNAFRQLAVEDPSVPPASRQQVSVARLVRLVTLTGISNKYYNLVLTAAQWCVWWCFSVFFPVKTRYPEVLGRDPE